MDIFSIITLSYVSCICLGLYLGVGVPANLCVISKKQEPGGIAVLLGFLCIAFLCLWYYIGMAGLYFMPGDGTRHLLPVFSPLKASMSSAIAFSALMVLLFFGLRRATDRDVKRALVINGAFACLTLTLNMILVYD